MAQKFFYSAKSALLFIKVSTVHFILPPGALNSEDIRYVTDHSSKVAKSEKY